MKTLIVLVILAVPAFARAQDAPAPFQLVETRSYASCADHHVVDAQGAMVPLPPDAAEALVCPATVNLHGVHLTYVHALEVVRLDLSTSQRVELFGLFPEFEGIEGPRWSPDGRSMLFRVVDQQRRNGYTESSRLIVVTVEDGQVTAKRKFDRFVNFVCGSTCASIHPDDFGFRDDDTLFYRRHWAASERPEEFDEIDLPARFRTEVAPP